MLSHCGALLPAWLCDHAGLLGTLALYLAPSAAVAVLIALLVRLHPAFLALTVIGTLCHELAHLGVGLLVGARPQGFSIIPRKVRGPRQAHYWQLGAVTLARLRWYNAAPAALAPLLLLALPFGAALWRTRAGWQFDGADLVIALLLAPQWLSFWPSAVDWRVAGRSWPYLPLLLALLGTLRLFHLVKI